MSDEEASGPAGLIRVTERVAIDPADLEESFLRASGPGGQNVNKVETAVQLRFDLRNAATIPDDVRRRAGTLAGSRLTKDGVVVITAQRFRNQERNREDALERLVELLREAAYRPPPRRPTRPSKGAKARRMDSKTKRGRVKKLRQGRPDAD